MGTVTFSFLFFVIITLSGCRCALGCKGRVILTESSGVISDGDQNYKSYTRCEWLIDAGDENKVIYLEFDFVTTECAYDFLFIFDGDSYQSPKLASLSGQNSPEPLLSTGGKMLIYLFSDRNYNLQGFQVRYLIQDCPFNCSGNGRCIDHECVCDTRFTGRGCEKEICPEDCGAHGHCDNSDNFRGCQCDPGFSGYLCNISLNDAVGSEYWYTVAPAGSGFEARSAHAGTFLSQSNCLYIFGGFTLNDILNDLKKFCFEENRWEDITHMDPWPDGRYEHAIVAYKHGFYMYGGVLNHGYSNELWYYNASSESWKLCAENSTSLPRNLSGHTFTLVEEELYLFGGKTEDGSFWSDIYKISAEDPSEWTEVIPYGGKSSARRLVGHSAVYHKESRSLIIFGGYSHSEDQPRFGTHTDKIHAFNIDNKVWSSIHQEKKDGKPSQRSFHSALIMGNYMVIYGGNTHIHHDNELCYDYEMYLYHLGCHSWVKTKYLMGKYNVEKEGKQLPGRVSHVAVAAYGNLLVVSGGFSGYARGDLMAFKFPSYVAPPQAEASLDLDFCTNYTGGTSGKCGYNPECFQCDNVSTTNTKGCIHRTQKHLCRETTPFNQKVECPGICSSLKTCHECLSQGQGASLTEHSPEKWTYIQPCNWCVKDAECQRRSDPEKTCRDAKDTVSGIIGWWGGKSESLSQLSQCAVEDFPAGLQAIKYRPQANFKQPDEVKIIRETTEAEKFRHIYSTKSYDDTIRWTGFIHPLNATVKLLNSNHTVIYKFKLKAENISFDVRISRNDSIEGLERIVNERLKSKQDHHEFEYRPDQVSPIFPNASRGSRYFLNMTGEYLYPQHSDIMAPGKTMYQLEMEWNGISGTTSSKLKNDHPFTSEFLEPYSRGNCDIHNNCLGCMTDALCAWCDLDNTCVLRNASGKGSLCTSEDSPRMLVTDGGTCPVCEDHVECLSCAQDPLCEWVKDYVVCVRRGRVNITKVTAPKECPAACHGRSSCGECLLMRECAWCENLHTCLPFSDYVSRHRHGQCTEWIDSEESDKNPYSCRNCSAKKTCEICLNTFSCGWCGNTINPTIGVCVEGDFSGPYGNLTCDAIVNKVHRSVPINESADWSYNTCPDVEECLLELAKCHKNATCINTPTSYDCSCNRGYEGDGVNSCVKTCYYKCDHGMCLEDPPGEFFCDCDLGWTGLDCSQDCLCNRHSMCEKGQGLCDYCDNNTTGEHCEQCKVGYFGDPSKQDGCYECRCNEHGDPELGLCYNQTGSCFCMDNTFGFECQDCLDGYYGDPRDGGKCYLSCDHGMIVKNITRGSLGSHKGPGVSTWKAYCLWIMTIALDTDRAYSLTDIPTITVGIEDLAVECERDHVYVYDGIPKFVDSRRNGVLLGAFCGFYTREFHSVTVSSGIFTIYFSADISGNYSSTRGFNASYFVNDCQDKCSASDNKHCLAGKCVCMPGYTGRDCRNRTCQMGCTYDETTTSCRCEANFGGVGYQVSSFPWVPVSMETSSDSATPVSRYGHTIIHCDDTVMYMFGGRSLEHGLLNDIWLYSFETQTWTEIIPITLDQPAARYFHAGACVPVRKNLYIFGGLVEAKSGNLVYEASKEMWKFAIDAKKWTGPIQPAWVMGLAGHSMTLVEETKLVIIGGFSTTKYFSDTVYKFDANSYLTAWQTYKWDNITGAKPTGIYGHSAVYNAASGTIYIYGGHVYRQERLFVSDSLFTYDIKDKSWNILQPEKNSKVEARFFHTAVGFNDYMAIIGGHTQYRNTSDKILIYKYKCNFWYMLDFRGTPLGKVLTTLIGPKAVLYNNSIILTGGYNSTLNSLMYKITLPEDLCTLSSDFNTCTLVYGCQARVIHHSNGENVTLCNTNELPAPESTLGPVVQTNSGTVCNYNWHTQRDCSSITECSECIAVYPQFKSPAQSCHWCSKCSIGKCLPMHKDCVSTGENKCQEFVRDTSVQVSQPSCHVPCLAATCDRCLEMDCIWSQHFKRVLYTAGEVKWKQSLYPKLEWSCVLKSLKKNLDGYPVFVVPPETCPAPCYVHSTCDKCLDSYGGEGGSQECYWSETLNECMPPAYLSLRCLAGACGTLLKGTSQKCPQPCDVHKKCGDCRKAPGCGWCAFGGLNGLGVCMTGTRSGPRGQCDNFNVSYEDRKLEVADIEDFRQRKSAPTWAYATCPPEDECSNGHHSCNVATQNCKDTLEGYICECKEGYIWNEEVAECKPVCHQGCVHGLCTLPDTCQCHFGFVGKNCSTECECNRHSNCQSVEKKNVCLKCMNNTQGKDCQECKPLFVGNPRNGGKCVSCAVLCNNHTDICLSETQYNTTVYKHIQRLREEIPDTSSPEFHDKIAEYLLKGPAEGEKTYCVDCQHHTEEKHCEKCEQGYFRLTAMSPAEPCTKCMCNGHSDECSKDGGLNCDCKNNTETKCSAEVKLKISCHEVQCAVCKEYFLGTPTDGHQCYRQMNVNREYCFDPSTQNDCTRSPDPLLQGRTVFFAVQPKYVNVDIRVTIDVTQGGMDVYFSPRDSTFTVDVDKITGIHTVKLDSDEHFISLDDQFQHQDSDLGHRARNIRSVASNSTIIRDYTYVMHEKRASDLNTFITVSNPDTILLIRNVRYRLVITLPCDLLDLRTSRFYIIFLSTGDGSRNETYGSLYFRQDQPHIDLFVFFSVFFSCFFLFLAMCVLLWKTKQAFDARQSRQQRAREMLHMASRPFAKVLVLIEHLSPFNISPNLNLLRSVKNTVRTPLLPSETSLPSSPIIVRHSFDIVPIAIEPTDDGVAGVVSVVFQLPGGAQAPSQLCLGSTLTKGYQLTHLTGKQRRLPNSSQC